MIHHLQNDRYHNNSVLWPKLVYDARGNCMYRLLCTLDSDKPDRLPSCRMIDCGPCHLSPSRPNPRPRPIRAIVPIPFASWLTSGREGISYPSRNFDMAFINTKN